MRSGRHEMTWLEAIGTRMTPVNFGPMKQPHAHASFKGACGDTMAFWLEMDGRQIVHATFTTDGCQTSLACGSIAAHLCQGRSLEQARQMRPQEILEILRREEEEEVNHCALLATRTLGMALDQYDQAWRQAHDSCKDAGEGCGDSCCEDCHEPSDQTPAPGQNLPGQVAAGPLDRIKHRILVLSGKGGVGKSTVATNLALQFAAQGLNTGLLDVDLHGPSVPKLLGLDSERLQAEEGQLLPVELGTLKVMSMGFALEAAQATIWRGPMKASVVDQFVRRTAWEDLDVLVVDCPPGTGDEHLSLVGALERIDGAVIVTTPQGVATLDAQKAINFCTSMKVPILGVVENMSGLNCPSCGTSIPVFSMHGGEHMATAFAVPFLGSIPLDPDVAAAGDLGASGRSLQADSATATAFRAIFAKVAQALEGQAVG